MDAGHRALGVASVPGWEQDCGLAVGAFAGGSFARDVVGGLEPGLFRYWGQRDVDGRGFLTQLREGLHCFMTGLGLVVWLGFLLGVR